MIIKTCVLYWFEVGQCSADDTDFVICEISHGGSWASSLEFFVLGLACFVLNVFSNDLNTKEQENVYVMFMMFS